MSYADTFKWITNYVNSSAYLPSSAESKREYLWIAGQKTRYPEIPPMVFPFVTAVLGLMNLPVLRRAFHVYSDVREPRRKIFHPYGTSAKVVWEPAEGHGFTGLFQTGAVGITRLSLGTSPDLFMSAVAFKWCVDNGASQHLMFFRNLNPDPVHDFFNAPTMAVQASISDPPARPPTGPFWWIVNPYLSLISYPTAQPTRHLAAVDRYGGTVGDPRFPYEVLGEPSAEVRAISNAVDDFRAVAARIPAGTVLYELRAVTSKGDLHTVPVGRIRTQSEFTVSAFGDQVLSMHHIVTKPKDW
jgi:hypothetical protein